MRAVAHKTRDNRADILAQWNLIYSTMNVFEPEASQGG